MESHTRERTSNSIIASGAQETSNCDHADKICRGCQILTVFSPLVLTADLLLLLGCEIVGDVEGLSDLFWRLALDHVGNGLAANVEQSLDVKVICGL